MMLNMDRNTLWGSAGGMVFENESSWDVTRSLRIRRSQQPEGLQRRGDVPCKSGAGAVLLQSAQLDAKRSGRTSQADGAEGTVAEAIPATDLALCRSRSRRSVSPACLRAGRRKQPTRRELAGAIETKYYTARIDPKTGALVSLRMKPSGRELLGGPANVLVAEKTDKQEGDPGDFTVNREHRIRLATSNDFTPKIKVTQGPLATTVIVEGDFYGGKTCRRLTRFYADYPRIDCEVDFEDLPDRTVLVAEFPHGAGRGRDPPRHPLRLLARRLGEARSEPARLDERASRPQSAGPTTACPEVEVSRSSTTGFPAARSPGALRSCSFTTRPTNTTVTPIPG